jgi:hypothetical protein
MRLTFAAVASAAIVLMAATGDSRAQQGSEQCLRLEAQLAAVDRGGRRQDPRQIEQAIAKQRNELGRTSSYAKGLGCGRRFFFAPDPPAECGPLNDRIRQMEINLDKLQAQAAQAAQGGGGDPRRRELLFALARNQCGPQYRLVERRVQSAQPEKRGFFDMLFGGGGSEAPREETVVEPEMDPQSTPRVSTYRTVCVRTCDGFFFPVSYATTRNAFERDEAICQATCPGSEAKLFAYPNPGGRMEQAAGVDGEPYTKLPNAFRYRKEYVSGCSCKPEGMSWAQALAGVDDKTVKKGDIIVDEQKAQEMSRPKTPAEAQAQAQAQPRARRPAPEAQPAPPEERPPAPAPRGGGEDYIILDDRPSGGGAVERRSLDGPNVERAPR